jgi:hypothetical protein
VGLESGKSVDRSHGVGIVVAGMGMWRRCSVQWLHRVKLSP